MRAFRVTVVSFLTLILCHPSQAQTPPQVLVTDSGVQTAIIGPGAPAHTIGLQGHRQTIVMDTGTRTYGLRYVIARDPKNQQAAIPGEGYSGMPQPVDCNWYGGGFFDVQQDLRRGDHLAHAQRRRALRDAVDPRPDREGELYRRGLWHRDCAGPQARPA